MGNRGLAFFVNERPLLPFQMIQTLYGVAWTAVVLLGLTSVAVALELIGTGISVSKAKPR